MVARLIASLLAATFAVALAAGSAPAAGTPDNPAGARLGTCRFSAKVAQRVAVVETWMRPIPGGRRLMLKIDLWERRPGERWIPRSDVPGLARWTSPSDMQLGSQPGDVFKYNQAVGRLEAPAFYRFHVTFRWLDAAGAIVRALGVTTGTCRQPDVRPDLVLRSVTAAPSTGSPGLVDYTVRVANEGKTPIARTVIFASFPPDLNRDGRLVRNLDLGEVLRVTFTGPGCLVGGQPAAFFADPANGIDESDETNNVLSASCPAP